MAASILYVDFEHSSIGKSIFTKIILIIFTIISAVCYILVVFMEMADLLNFSQLTFDEAQESIINMILFSVPVLHCIFLGYIWYTRRKMDQRSADSYSEAQKQLNPASDQYLRQVDDIETNNTGKN